MLSATPQIKSAASLFSACVWWRLPPSKSPSAGCTESPQFSKVHRRRTLCLWYVKHLSQTYGWTNTLRSLDLFVFLIEIIPMGNFRSPGFMVWPHLVWCSCAARHLTWIAVWPAHIRLFYNPYDLFSTVTTHNCSSVTVSSTPLGCMILPLLPPCLCAVSY